MSRWRGQAGPRIARLPYLEDAARRFEGLLKLPWAAWLDSGYPRGGGRYDICVADPYLRLVTRGGVTELQWADGRSERLRREPLGLLREHLAPKTPLAQPPFAGGALGYFSYELGRSLEGLDPRVERADGWPELAVGLYDWALVTDHVARRCWLAASGRDARAGRRWRDLVAALRDPPALPPPRAPAPKGPLNSNLTPRAYDACFERIRRYIRDGDCYQVNFAQRFVAPVRGSPWSSYRALRELSPAPYGAFLHYPFGQVLSVSPEQFLDLADGRVTTRPIKGTRPRGETRALDEALRIELAQSPKDRAENLMIVDLLRNDLGKSCRPGSVKVPRLFELETFANLHHLVSMVAGELRDGIDALDLLRGCFPGGSITGAPKHRAMQIIDELEPDSRELYCGSIGYIGFDGSMQSNIAIRTALWRAGTLAYWAGGGIVADSDPAAEYRETLVKANALFRLLGADAATGRPLIASL